MKRKGLIVSRLKSSRGETLAETLVAVLISALSLVILAGMITAATRLITKSRDSVRSYVESENALADPASAGTEGTVIIRMNSSEIKPYDGSSGTGIGVYYYELSAAGRKVVSYRVK